LKSCNMSRSCWRYSRTHELQYYLWKKTPWFLQSMCWSQTRWLQTPSICIHRQIPVSGSWGALLVQSYRPITINSNNTQHYTQI
jgi:hypothetical protein